MEFPLVSLGRYRDMRERAENAEKQVRDLIDALEELARSRTSAVAPTARAVQPTESGVERREARDVTLPPMVEHAIRKRARVGSPLEAQLMEQARTAIETMGPDFDESAYAKQVLNGTRIDGWPV